MATKEWQRDKVSGCAGLVVRPEAVTDFCETWLKPLGGSWVKVADWIDGVTADFSWIIPAEDVGGHHVFSGEQIDKIIQKSTWQCMVCIGH